MPSPTNIAISAQMWWAHQDSNLEPKDYEART